MTTTDRPSPLYAVEWLQFPYGAVRHARLTWMAPALARYLDNPWNGPSEHHHPPNVLCGTDSSGGSRDRPGHRDVSALEPAEDDMRPCVGCRHDLDVIDRADRAVREVRR